MNTTIKISWGRPLALLATAFTACLVFSGDAIVRNRPETSGKANAEALYSAKVKALLRTDGGEPGECGRTPRNSRELAAKTAAWLEKNAKGKPWRVVTNDTGKVCVKGRLTQFRPLCASVDFTVEMDDGSEWVVAYGTLPACVPAERRKEVRSLLEKLNGSSACLRSGVLSLDGDMRVQWHTAMPREAFRAAVDEAIARIATWMAHELIADSKSISHACLGMPLPKEETPDNSFTLPWKDPYAGFEGNPCDEYDCLVEAWLEKEGVKYQRQCSYALTAYFGTSSKDRRKECEFDGSLYMCDDSVMSRYYFPVKIPDARRGAVSDFVMAYNATRPPVLLFVDIDDDMLLFQSYTPVWSFLMPDSNPAAKRMFRQMLELASRTGNGLSDELKKVIAGQ